MHWNTIDVRGAIVSTYARKDGFKIKKVTDEFIIELLNSIYARVEDKYSPLGLFYFEQSGNIIACDNSTGDAYIEEFKDEKMAISWLNSKAGEIMNVCKFCKCDDLHACKGGCFWVDKNKTICSTCAVTNKVVFVNNITKSKAIIVEAFVCNLDMLAVTFKYESGGVYSYHLSAFMDRFSEVQS